MVNVAKKKNVGEQVILGDDPDTSLYGNRHRCALTGQILSHERERDAFLLELEFEMFAKFEECQIAYRFFGHSRQHEPGFNAKKTADERRQAASSS